MAVKQASETVVKRSDESKRVNKEFEQELTASETISSVQACTVSPAGELTVNQAISGTQVQILLASGLGENAFTASASTDTLTATAHGLTNGHPVHVIADGADNLPGGLDETTQYYVIAATADTLQLALTSGGSAIDITSDGQGTIGVDYTVTTRIATSTSQVVVGEGVCQVRS
jgi:hypothetical protein